MLFLRWTGRALRLLCFPMWPLFWLLCRLQSKQCPQCGSKWQTELVGEWDGQHWKCHSCGHYWETR